MKLWLSLIVVLCCTAYTVEAARKAYVSQGVLVEGCSTTVCCVSERGFHQCPHNGGTCCSNSGYCCPSGFRCTSTFGQPSCTQIPAMRCNAAIGCTLKDWIRPRMVGSESSHSEHSFHSEHSLHSEHSMHSQSMHSGHSHSEHSHSHHSHSESSRAVESSAPAPSHPPAPLFPPPNLELESGGHQPGQAEVSKQDAADSLQGVAAIASALPVGVTITTTKNIGGKVYTTTITRNSANGKSIIGGESSEGSAPPPPSSSSMPPSESSAPPHSGVLAPSESSAPAGNCETSACRKGKLKINSNVEVSLTKKHLK